MSGPRRTSHWAFLFPQVSGATVTRRHLHRHLCRSERRQGSPRAPRRKCNKAHALPPLQQPRTGAAVMSLRPRSPWPSACPSHLLFSGTSPGPRVPHLPARGHSGTGVRAGVLIKHVLGVPRALWSSVSAAWRLLKRGFWKAAAVFMALAAATLVYAVAQVTAGPCQEELGPSDLLGTAPAASPTCPLTLRRKLPAGGLWSFGLLTAPRFW